MKKSLLLILSVFLSLLLFSCATGSDTPRAEIGGEITIVGATPGIEMEVKIPFDSEKKEETTAE